MMKLIFCKVFLSHRGNIYSEKNVRVLWLDAGYVDAVARELWTVARLMDKWFKELYMGL